MHADQPPFDTFDTTPESRWDYIADNVMGGVSSGQVRFDAAGGTSFARLTGTVSTANNGGFIQFRRPLDQTLPPETQGVSLTVRGNGEPYFVHLRTTGTRLPWQYYQAQFETSAGWQEIRLPWSAFKPSGRLMRKTPSSSAITSVGIVAFGRDHNARVDVSEVDFFR